MDAIVGIENTITAVRSSEAARLPLILFFLEDIMTLTFIIK